MRVFEAHMSDAVCDYFKDLLKKQSGHDTINERLYNEFGIVDFFETDHDIDDLRKRLVSDKVIDDRDKIEYGDFQTNITLANRIARKVGNEFSPRTVIEPTCGKGNFILASLENFKTIDKVIGIEVYKPYIWETKFSIIEHYLQHKGKNKPDIHLFHSSVFDFDFKNLEIEDDLLVIGNPPWVTNAKLGTLGSSNLPKKSNFKKLNGWDAVTGKGNFDIGEYITLMMFDAFQNRNGRFAFLVKNSVIKNVMFDQKDRRYNIGDICRYSIDSKAEFNVAVEASLLACPFNRQPSLECSEYSSIEDHTPFNHIGWVGGKFVSSIDKYALASDIDGTSPFVWRSGLKHDCSPIMELERVNGHFVNGKGMEARLEETIVYGLLKSSDLKRPVISSTRKQVIVTQKKVGQETDYIQKDLPLTYTYLSKNSEMLDARGSSIYKGKPQFSIFGIGEYSFKPYKVSISGLYKKYDFNLVMPENDKPLMLDDTCYFLGFDKLDHAVYTYVLLNSERVKNLLKAISFMDAKRVFTKDVLMRVDLKKLSETADQNLLKREIEKFNAQNAKNATLDHWQEFVNTMIPKPKNGSHSVVQ
jgi:hypothetical protein